MMELLRFVFAKGMPGSIDLVSSSSRTMRMATRVNSATSFWPVSMNLLLRGMDLRVLRNGDGEMGDGYGSQTCFVRCKKAVENGPRVVYGLSNSWRFSRKYSFMCGMCARAWNAELAKQEEFEGLVKFLVPGIGGEFEPDAKSGNTTNSFRSQVSC